MAENETSEGLLSEGEVTAIKAVVDVVLAYVGVGAAIIPLANAALDAGNRIAAMGQTVPGLEQLQAEVNELLALPQVK